MKYAAFLALWVFLYWATGAAGPWYDTYYHFNQSLIAASLIWVSSYLLASHWWLPDYKIVAALHILHNFGDLVFDFPGDNYSNIQATINGLELVVLLGFPLGTVLAKSAMKCYRKLRNAGRSGHSRTNDYRPAASIAARGEDAR